MHDGIVVQQHMNSVNFNVLIVVIQANGFMWDELDRNDFCQWLLKTIVADIFIRLVLCCTRSR